MKYHWLNSKNPGKGSKSDEVEDMSTPVSERAMQIIEALEVSEINNYQSVEKYVDRLNLGTTDKDYIKSYMKEYINAED